MTVMMGTGVDIIVSALVFYSLFMVFILFTFSSVPSGPFCGGILGEFFCGIHQVFLFLPDIAKYIDILYQY